MAEPSKTDLQFLDQFEPDVFWQQHGKKILIGLVAIAAVILIFVQQQRQAEQAEAEAARRLAQAGDPGSLQRIAEEYRNKPLGAQALFRLGDLHYQAGRLREASAAYQELINNYPQHPLIDTARLGLAAVSEAQGNFEAARDQYSQLAGRPGSYAAIAGKVGLARCLEALGQDKQARQLYEELMPSVMGTPWEAEVSIRWAVLGRDVQPVLAPAPSQNQEPTGKETP